MNEKAMRKMALDHAHHGMDSGGGETEVSCHNVMGIKHFS